MCKEFFRNFFTDYGDFIKYSWICKSADVDLSNFISFLHGHDERISLKKLKVMYNVLIHLFDDAPDLEEL